MPANFTRRLDLFKDAGFADPDAAVASTSALASVLPVKGGAQDALVVAVEKLTRSRPVSPALANLVRRTPEWIFQRGGDLATALWLTHQQHGGDLDLGAWTAALVHELLQAGRQLDGFSLLRFLADVDLDFGQIQRERGPAYGFFQEREPNPFVWKLLEHLEGGHGPLQMVELGCGVGNDALGFLSSPRVAHFTGIDISPEALAVLRRRSAIDAARVTAVQGDFAAQLRRPEASHLQGVNLIYSYSSLHYFNSVELSEILKAAHHVLLPRRGVLAFAIKGAGSIWDGQGVPLYRPDVWINWDGQSRWFPSVEALDLLMDRHGFVVRRHELHEHWGYSVRGRKDIFHYVICTAG